MEEKTELEKLLEEYSNPPTCPRPAAEIMKAPAPTYDGPRRERTRGGGQRWVVRLRARRDLKRILESAEYRRVV